jgi:putative tryptophan/tyrosine transport system substrate-binding protein
MRRREFLGFVGAAMLPVVARGQQQAMPVIGFLFTGSPPAAEPLLIEFRRGLAESGYVEGKNVIIEYRWGLGQYEKLPTLASDLVSRKVAVLAPSAPPSVFAAKSATSSIPIVFSVGDDPVRLGLVSSLNRPGGNLTGASYFATALEAKRIELLLTLLPGVQAVGVLVNQSFPGTANQVKDIEASVHALRKRTNIVYADNPKQIEDGFASLEREKVEALLVGADPFFFNQRQHIVNLAARHSIPTIYQLREFTAAGGLISYGTVIKDAYRQQGAYVGRVLKGEKPADLPIVLATKFELVINTKTAKALGLTIPDKLLALADEVIE